MTKPFTLIFLFLIACNADTSESSASRIDPNKRDLPVQNNEQISSDAGKVLDRGKSRDQGTLKDVGDDGGRDPGLDMDKVKDATQDPPEILRFVAIGDQGEGNQKQYDVGVSMGKVCDALGGCDFGLLLGDNFYDSGVDSVNDDMFNSHFAMPYNHLDFPFYAVLGNHDLGGGGLGIDLDRSKADYQIRYSQMNPKWIMPSEYYSFSAGPVFFAGLDTTDIFFRGDSDQERDIPAWASSAGTKWKIAFGHHPYISNGKHGNAGEYDGVKFLPIANGEYIEDFVKDHICGKYDFYLAGHDHSRQDLVSKCGTEFIVSGAGAKTTEIKGNNPNHFQSDKEGFLLMEATESTMKIQFYDKDGNLDHTRRVTR